MVKKWAVIPLLVARRFKRQDVWICPMEGGPEDMTIYGLTKENRMDDQIRRVFSVCERRTADDRWDRTVFRKIKRDSGRSEKFTIKFQTGKKEPGHRNIPPGFRCGPFFKSYNL